MGTTSFHLSLNNEKHSVNVDMNRIKLEGAKVVFFDQLLESGTSVNLDSHYTTFLRGKQIIRREGRKKNSSTRDANRQSDIRCRSS